MKILFVGNSYTYYNDMPKILEALANANGHDLQTHQITKGGWFLHAYLDTKDEFHDKLMTLIRDNRYDICFLQEQSLCPVLDYDRFANGAKRLQQLLQPVTGTFILYETWARKEGHPALEKYDLTVESMAQGLVHAYERLGRELGVQVSPVGRLFPLMRKEDPSVELYNDDRTHPSYAGSCLAALRHYKTIFGTLPTDTSVLDLPEETAARMCRLISES